MSVEKRFNFVGGSECSQRYFVSYRLDLGETPRLAILQRILYDLYAQQRLEPQYLFVAMRDQYALTLEMRSHPSMRYRLLSDVFEEFGLDSPLGGMIRRIRSEVTGHPVDLVALPGLEQGSVILGFFR